MKLIFVTAALLFSLSSMARVLSTEEKLSDFQALNALMKSSYGPYLYKQETQGIDVKALQDRYTKAITEAKTNADFYYLMVQYVAEYRDGHFRMTLASDFVSQIPIQTDLVDGKVLIDSVDRTKLTESAFPFAKGDEIVSVDGRPIEEVLKELQTYMATGYELTAKRMAAMSLPYRGATRLPAPTGKITLEIRHGSSNIIEPVTLDWETSGTRFDEGQELNIKELAVISTKNKTAREKYDELSIVDDAKEFLGPRLERSFWCSGETRISMPKDATVIIEKPFIAYYYPTAKGNIGYLRIPHYNWDGQYDEVFAQYEAAVAELEANTVGLIIDQDHNCGGSVDFLHRMISLFMDTSFQPMQFKLLASKKEYNEIKSWLSEVPNKSIAQKNIQTVVDLIKTTWDKGEFLTPLTSIDGTPTVAPHSIHYTKPIVMTIDEMSGSGGDAFPSLMKGFGRATLVGTRTMGLGGHVVDQPAFNYSALLLRMTKSLFFRPDGVAVENNGAVPDFNYTITRDDFMYGYKNYQKFYEKVLFDKIP